MKHNPILQTDSYKLSHFRQYPPGTEEVYSYLESRGGKFDHTLFFGLQYILKEYLSKPVTHDDLLEAAQIAAQHLGSDNIFGYSEWKSLIEKHDGMLPVEIWAVPEGSVVPTGNVMMAIRNTDPEFYWVTNFIESLLLKVWYPITVATQSLHAKLEIQKALAASGSKIELANFMLHDFGYRGVSSEESAAIGGAAHLLNFMGTDTLPALSFLREYYGASEMPGFSVPASEHSTMTSWGKDGESLAYANMLEKYPTGIVSVVSDSWDIFNACENIWGDELKDKVNARDGRLVIRPDSGEVVPTLIRVLKILLDKFDSTTNKAGFSVLPDNVRVLQGDGINSDSIVEILDALLNEHIAVENVVLGMGGALLQKVDRDTQNFAIKCSSVVVDGEQRDVSKNPVGQAMKKSKAGYLGLYKDPLASPSIYTATQDVPGSDRSDMMQLVWKDGKIRRIWHIDEIKETIDMTLQLNDLKVYDA